MNKNKNKNGKSIRATRSFHVDNFYSKHKAKKNYCHRQKYWPIPLDTTDIANTAGNADNAGTDNTDNTANTNNTADCQHRQHQ